LVKNFLNFFRIPYPEVRLSEFFVTPTALRDLVPLYDRTAKAVIVLSEEEYCQNARVSSLIDGCPNDVGVAGSNTSDWNPFSNPNSTKRNYQWDPGEPYDDTGIWDGKQTVPGTAGNGIQDSRDIDFYWPTGGNIGGPFVTISVDFRNTTPADVRANTQCIDELHFFLPDPTASGVLTFPDPITNIDTRPLNDNAKLHRFVITALQAIKAIASYGLP